MDEMVSMTHPELDTTIEVFPSAVAIHRASGWLTEEDKPVTQAPPPETDSGDAEKDEAVAKSTNKRTASRES